MLFTDISIRYKILLITTVAILSFSGYVSYNYMNLKQNNQHLDNIRDVYFPILEKTNANLVRMDKIQNALLTAIEVDDEDEIEVAKELVAEFNGVLSEINQLDDENTENVELLRSEMDNYSKVAISISQGMISGELEAADMSAKSQDMLAKHQLLIKSLKHFRFISHEKFTGEIKAIDLSGDNGIRVGLTIGGIATFILILTSFFVVKSVTGNINAVVVSLKEIASGRGDLTQRLVQKGKDEVGDLVYWFNEFINKLQLTITGVKNTEQTLNDVTEQITTTIADTRDAAFQQQTMTRAIVATIQDMLGKVDEVTQHAEKATAIAIETSTDAETGKKVIGESIESIGDLAQEVNKAVIVISEVANQSNDIGSVIDVIDQIADQTNLLALNAAIEAARAGEQGRGFAVVADEVRTLAGNTRDATLKIKEMIDALQQGTSGAVGTMNISKDKTDISVEYASNANVALENIIKKITNITIANHEISDAATEQNSSSSKISEHVDNVEFMASKTAKSADNTAEHSERLKDTSTNLHELISQFNV